MSKNYTTCNCPRHPSGDPCQRPAGWGTDHVGEGFCKLHDGKEILKAQDAEARAIIAQFGGRKDIHPAQALLELVQNKAAEVDYWRAKATDADWKELAEVGIGGKVYKKVTLEMLHEAEEQLSKFSQACIRVGVEEVRVRAMAVQGEAIVAAMKVMLSDPRLGVLTGAPVEEVIRDTLKRVSEESSPAVAIGRWKA